MDHTKIGPKVIYNLEEWLLETLILECPPARVADEPMGEVGIDDDVKQAESIV